MRRAILGIVALLLVAAGVAMHLAKFEAGSATFTSAILIKSGAVLLLFWLAYHQVLRFFEIVPPWMIGGGLLGVAAVIAYPKSLIVALCLFAGLLVLHYAGTWLKPQDNHRKRSKPKKIARNKAEAGKEKS